MKTIIRAFDYKTEASDYITEGFGYKIKAFDYSLSYSKGDFSFYAKQVFS